MLPTNGLVKPSVNGGGRLKDPAVTARIDAIWDELAIMSDGKGS